MQAGLRAEHITRETAGRQSSSFSPRPAFADDTVVSVNPKVSAAWLVSPLAAGRRRQRVDAPARRRRHRHPSAGRVRDRVHRQSGR